jgi:hypothetical protein
MLAIKSWLTALCILSARTKPLHYVASSTTTGPKSGLSVYNTTVIGVRAEEWGVGGGLSIIMVKGLWRWSNCPGPFTGPIFTRFEMERGATLAVTSLHPLNIRVQTSFTANANTNRCTASQPLRKVYTRGRCVCRPVGGRDSSGGGRVKTEEEEDGKKAQRPGTIQYTEGEVDIYLYRAATPYRGKWWFV